MMPIERDVLEEKYPIRLFLKRRDLGITAAIVAAVALAVGGAVTAGVAVSQTVQTASVINQLSSRVTSAFEIQETLNGQIHFGTLSLNQQTALLQEQINWLHVQQRLVCDLGYSEICVTSADVDNAQGQVKLLNEYLKGPWNATFLNYTIQLAQAVAAINATRVEPIGAIDFWNSLAKVAGWMTRWSGTIALFLLCCGGMGGSLWCLCCLCQSQKHQWAIARQAFLALQPPIEAQVWVSMLETK